MDETIIVIIFLFVILIVGGIVGFLLAKLKFKLFKRKIGKKADKIMEELNKLKKDNLDIQDKREARDNDRRRDSNHRRESIGTEGSRDSETSKPTRQHNDKGTDDRRSDVQDSELNKTGEPKSNNESSPGSNEQSEQEFDWSW